MIEQEANVSNMNSISKPLSSWVSPVAKWKTLRLSLEFRDLSVFKFGDRSSLMGKDPIFPLWYHRLW